MRFARRLRQEVDLWGVTWQQVETFIDRISGAADQDASARRKVEALLAVAAVVERARRPNDTKALGAPVSTVLPTIKQDRDGNKEAISDPWAAAERVTRLPGLDDLELAAAPVSAVNDSGEPVDGDLTQVRLPGPRTVPSSIDRQTGAVLLGVMPSYDPGSTSASSSFVQPLPNRSGLLVDVADNGDVAGLFSVLRRILATMGDQPDVEHVRTWGEVAADRRSAVAATTKIPADPPCGRADAATLMAAADVLDEEGTDNADLPGIVRALATALAALPESPAAASAALAQLAATPLLIVRVENGPLRAELDAAVAQRLHYPDGSLRMLRTLETAFAWQWPVQARWFTTRRDLVLAPLLARFRAPFHASLRALVSGGDTGLLALGLTVGPATAVGATQVITGEPASLLASVADIEPGQVGVVGGGRPAALTILGLDTAGGRLALQVAPVRVSTAPGAPGLAGLVDGDTDISEAASGLSGHELRTGESDDGPAADGIVAETLALWSQSCAVFGRASVQAASVQIPDPSGGPLENLTLFGGVPARATTLVLTDLPAMLWDRSDPHDPVPRVARRGEVLLLRGVTRPDESAPPVTVQGVVEVDTVFATTGSMLDAMDLSTAGRLSTVELESDTDNKPVFRCGPEDDVAVVTLRRSTVDVPLTAPITLRRDFAGFDAISLAAGRLLPAELFGGASAGPAGVDRSREFAFALDTFTGWLRYAHG